MCIPAAGEMRTCLSHEAAFGRPGTSGMDASHFFSLLLDLCGSFPAGKVKPLTTCSKNEDYSPKISGMIKGVQSALLCKGQNLNLKPKGFSLHVWAKGCLFFCPQWLYLP